MDITHPKKTQLEIYEQLVNAIAEGNALAIVGSGSSKRIGYPSWDDLLITLSKEAQRNNPDKKAHLDSIRQADPYVFADEIKRILGPEAFYMLLQKIYGPEIPNFDDFHKILIRLPFQHLLTTNYDRILQATHENCKINYTEVDLNDPQKSGHLFDSINADNSLRHIIHIHGSIKNPQSIILSLEDYNRQYENRNDFKLILTHIFTKRIIFIGFSLNDKEFLGPLKILTACLGTGEPRHYAILPKPDDQKIPGLREKLRKLYRIEPFFYDSIDNHAALIPILEELNKDVEKRRVELIKEKVTFLTESKVATSTEIYRELQKITSIAGLLINTISVDATKPDYRTRTNLDLEIDEIFKYVKSGQPEIAIEMYKAILERKEEKIIPRLKYRLHANIGNALYNMNLHNEAANEYFRATDYWSETKEAQALRALGHILRKECKQALSITDSICRRWPDYPRAYALHLQAMPTGCSFKNARKSVPMKIRRNPEVAYALSSIAHEEGLQKRCEIYSKIAWESSPDWIEAGLSYAVSIMIDEKKNAIICGGTKLIPRNFDRVKKAENILTILLTKSL